MIYISKWDLAFRMLAVLAIFNEACETIVTHGVMTWRSGLAVLNFGIVTIMIWRRRA